MSALPPDDAPFEPTGKWANPAIYAVNWRSILLVDAGIGIAVAVAGVVVVVLWNVLIGALVASLGLTYVVAVWRRYLQWRWLRRRAGLES